jgi:hypothetical protein
MTTTYRTPTHIGLTHTSHTHTHNHLRGNQKKKKREIFMLEHGWRTLLYGTMTS